MKREDINYWLHESPDAKSEAAIDAASRREELIDEKREEMIDKRMAALSDEDIVCALQSAWVPVMCKQIRAALQQKDVRQSYGSLSCLVSLWIREDSEAEAIKWMERMESPGHPCN